MKDSIETERLILRKVTLSDAEEIFHCWCNDEDVTRWLTWNPHKSVAETVEIVSRWVSEYDDQNTVRYVIAEKASGKLIGSIDVVSFHCGVPVVGYCSGKKFWNRGYMTEACKAFLGELKRLGYKLAEIRAVVENVGSNRVIQKCGGVLEATVWAYLDQKDDVCKCNSYVIDLEDLY